MVLDENALEAMLARQRDAERTYRPRESVRTEKTAEFEVYERQEEAEPAQGPDPPAAPSGAHFEELPRRTAPAGADETQHHVAVQRQQQGSGQGPPQQADPGQRPQADGAPRRPQVWPPIQSRAAPQEAPLAEPGHAPTPARAPPTEPGPWTSPSHAPSGSPGDRSHAPVEAAPHRVETLSPDAAPRPARHGGPSGRPTGHGGCRIAIVQATFNEQITRQMVEAAAERARQEGATVEHHVRVPGVFDLPLATQTLARRRDVDAVVVIGCVIQGETDHDDLITFTTAKTLQEIALATETPLGFGIIGPGMTWEQAQARIGNAAHAVDAAIAQWRTLQVV